MILCYQLLHMMSFPIWWSSNLKDVINSMTLQRSRILFWRTPMKNRGSHHANEAEPQT